MNCINCGAPRAEDKCSYCLTEYLARPKPPPGRYNPLITRVKIGDLTITTDKYSNGRITFYDDQRIRMRIYSDGRREEF